MKRPTRHSDGMYHVNGKKYENLVGSRKMVYSTKSAYKTRGGLTIKDLKMNKWGHIVSVNKSKTAKKEMRLQKYGYFAKKGKFGYVKRATRKSRK
jgi:hypothetical protein